MEIVSLGCLVSLLEIDDAERAIVVLVVAPTIIEDPDRVEAESLVLVEVVGLAGNDDITESDVGDRVVKPTDCELRSIVPLLMPELEVDESTVTIEEIVVAVLIVAELKLVP